VHDRGEWLPVEKLLTIGERIDLFVSEASEPPENNENSDSAESTRSRLASVLGQLSASRLEEGTVGIIGCSGTGSPAVHVLARAGLGNFVLVDPKRFTTSNLERLHGSRWDHISQEPQCKVELMAQLIESINPKARITALAGNILHENVVDELVRCDLLLGCTDAQHGRAKLSDLAEHYLLPSLDLGVLMEGQNGRLTSQLADISIYSPDLPCAFCCGRIDGTELSNELMSEEERLLRQDAAKNAEALGADPDQYWRQNPRQLHTVGYLTTMLGSLGAGYIEGWLTGTFAVPHPWLQFDIGRERLGVVTPPRTRIDGCSCGHHIGWGDLARSYQNVSKPDHWPNRAVLLRRT